MPNKQVRFNLGRSTNYISSVSHIKEKRRTKIGEDSVSSPTKSPKKYTSTTISPKPFKNPLGAMLRRFKETMKDDLVGYLEKPSGRPKFRVVTSGGYGLKTLLETKYGDSMKGKVWTSDIDITVSTYKSHLDHEEAFAYWSKRVKSFIYSTGKPEDFQVRFINFGGDTVPLMNFKRYYVIMISFKVDGVLKDFVDVAITDMKVTHSMIDTTTSLKAGLPVKKEEHYLQEFLTLIYMENVPGVSDYAYSKRNPVSGNHADKGLKDINRSKLICSVKAQGVKYRKYCNLLRGINLQKLQDMPKQKRDTYFKPLQTTIKDVAH
jgi:hypothetical protein